MFTCDYRKLSLSFNEFHSIEEKDMPDYSEFCLLELKDGRFTDSYKAHTRHVYRIRARQ